MVVKYSELRCYAPSSASPWCIEAFNVTLDHNANFPASLNAAILGRWARDYNENDPNCPLQKGAYIEWVENGSYLFRGKMKRPARTMLRGEPAVSISGLDKLQTLNETFAVYNSAYAWSRQTPPLALSNVTLRAGYDFGDGLRNVWWPDPSSSIWLSTAVLNSTTLGVAMTNVSPASGNRLKLAQTHGGLPPAGFISITTGGNTEWIEYNGYAWDAADQYWYAHNIRRASLGTTAVAHNIGDTVYSRIAKRLDPRGRIKIEGDNGGNFELVTRENRYAPQWESGAIAFPTNPLTLGQGGATFASLRLSAATCFDEQGGSQLYLSDVVTDILSANPALGGPGFGGGYVDTATIDVSSLGSSATRPDPVLTRVVVPKKTKAMNFLKGLLEENQLIRGGVGDTMMLRYDSPEDKVYLEYIGSSTNARTYFGEATRLEEASIEGEHSAVLVEYQQASQFNLVSDRNIWHTVVGLFGSGAPPGGAVPAAFQKVAGVWYGPAALAGIGTYNFALEVIVGGPGGTSGLVTDNDESTGMGLGWDTLQAAGTHFYAWCPGATATAPDLYYLTKLIASFELIGAGAGNSGGGTADIDFEFLVYDTFTGSVTTAAPTAGTAYPLSVKANVQYSAGRVGQQVKLEADLPFVPGRAIGIKVNGFLDSTDATIAGSGFKYCLLINELALYGVQVKHEFVTLTGTYVSGDTSKLVYAGGATKLIDIHMGQFNCGELSIGPATREVARNMGWASLAQSLAQARSRTYTITGDALDREGIAEVGEQVAVEGGAFDGTCDAKTYSVIDGTRTLTARMVDYASPLTGGPTLNCAALPKPRNPNIRRSEEIRKAATGRTSFTRLTE